MKNDCLFCAIIDGEIPSKKVYEDEQCYAFYDIEPQAPVHFLVVPKAHICCANAITADNSGVVAHCFEVIAKICRELGVESYRIVNNCGDQAGQTVKHLHFHVLAGREPALFSVRRCGAGRGRFTPLRGYTLSAPCGGTCLPAGRSVRGSDRPPACHSTPRTPGGRLRGACPQGEGWGKFWGCCPFAGNFFAFRGWGQTILIRGYGYEVQKERDGRGVRTVRPVRRRAAAGRAILQDQR